MSQPPQHPYGSPEHQPGGYGYPALYPYRYPPPIPSPDERLWATLAHLSPFAGGIVGFPVLGPLLVYLIFRDRSPFVRRHAANALNFHLTLLIAGVVGVVSGMVITVLTFGIGMLVLMPVVFLVVVAAVVLQIVAAVAANRGQEYRYPLTPQMVT